MSLMRKNKLSDEALTQHRTRSFQALIGFASLSLSPSAENWELFLLLPSGMAGLYRYAYQRLFSTMPTPSLDYHHLIPGLKITWNCRPWMVVYSYLKATLQRTANIYQAPESMCCVIASMGSKKDSSEVSLYESYMPYLHKEKEVFDLVGTAIYGIIRSLTMSCLKVDWLQVIYIALRLAKTLRSVRSTRNRFITNKEIESELHYWAFLTSVEAERLNHASSVLDVWA